MLPRPDHIVIVMEENHSYSDIIGSPDAPYMNLLAQQGAVFTQAYAITHPSQPNYLALFSGSTQGVSSDACPQSFSGPNLGSSLIHTRLSFAGYSESMPTNGYTGCSAPDGQAAYARKHNPWVNFTNVPASSNLTFSSFPTNYNMLPTVSFVIPNQYNDMHSGSVQQGDAWLKNHLSSYAQWARTHNSLLIITWDEDDGSASNQIPTLFVGSMVKAERYNEQIDHYSVLRTIEDMYGLPALNNSTNVGAISDVWQKIGT
jgi:acid phosphatase